MKIIKFALLLFALLFLVNTPTYASKGWVKHFNDGVDYGIKKQYTKAKELFEKALALPKNPMVVSVEYALKTVNDLLSKRIKQETADHMFQALSYEGYWNNGDRFIFTLRL